MKISTFESPLEKRAHLDTLLVKRLQPVLQTVLDPQASVQYMRELADLLLDSRPSSQNITYIPISEVADLLGWLIKVRDGDLIQPHMVATYHLVYQTLRHLLPKQPRFADCLPLIMGTRYDNIMPALARLEPQDMLMHIKLISRLNLTFEQAHTQLAAVPKSLWTDLLGTKR